MDFSIFQTLTLLLVVYLVSQITYRLYLSPISSIPGPKLAAATWWYEYYHDIINYGKYVFKIISLHEKYGPILRISPYEVHISDPEFYDTLYAASNTNRKDRWSWYTAGLGLPDSTLGTVEQGLHRRRRAAMSSFFSKQNVRKLLPLVQERAVMLVSRLQKLASSEETVPINLAFSAFTNDVITQYCFGASDHRIEAEGFDPAFHHISFAAGTSTGIMRHMNWILKITKALPESISMKLSVEMSSFVIQRRERINQINQIRGEMTGKEKEDRTIFHSLLSSDLPSSERTPERLAEEAILLTGAGTHTTAWVLSVSTFHLLSQPLILRKLRAELEAAIPDPNASTSLDKLEQLPYLTAVIKEGLRLAVGSASRIPRICPDKSIKYGEYEIAAGTPVSMTIPILHQDERIFPNANEFHPERWIEDKTGHLDRYLVSFGRGPRGCLGITLAWAELYVCVSTIFRRFGSSEVRGKSDFGVMELYETDLGDVEMARDGLFPIPKDGSKGVRVKLSS